MLSLLAAVQVILSVPAIRSEADFDRIAGKTNIPYPQKHVRFLIDRRKANQIYFIDSKDDRHHRDLAAKLYLSLDGEQDFFEKNTLRDDRRFLLGWVAYQPSVKKWTFEFWDGDLATTSMISLTQKVISKAFFTSLAFKPNSERQESLSANLKISRVSLSEISRNLPYIPLNLGFAIGRLKIVRDVADIADADPEDILVLDETPAGSPPVSGLVFRHPTTPLSHLGLLARGWRIPSATIRDADKQLAKMEGRWVAYRTEAGEFHIRPAEPAEMSKVLNERKTRKALVTPNIDLTETRLAALTDQRAADSRRYGAKSANLGEVVHGQIAKVQIPPGFTLPFSAYIAFVKTNDLDTQITAMLQDSNFRSGGPRRRAKLAELRKSFLNGQISKELANQVIGKVRDGLKGKGVFVRSSTNSEDLANFSGAGLYTTVPNVKGENALIEAVKTVWSSVWNDDAFLARERAGFDHTQIAMAVLIQEAVPSESSGVMITANPFDSADKDSIFISAKRGLGIRVVDGQKVPEQIVFREDTNAVQILTRSQDDGRLVFAPDGGIMTVPSPPDRAVLTDPLIRRLAATGKAIQRLFGNRPQDIEWAIVGDQIYILQSRPYLKS